MEESRAGKGPNKDVLDDKIKQKIKAIIKDIKYDVKLVIFIKLNFWISFITTNFTHVLTNIFIYNIGWPFLCFIKNST